VAFLTGRVPQESKRHTVWGPKPMRSTPREASTTKSDDGKLPTAAAVAPAFDALLNERPTAKMPPRAVQPPPDEEDDDAALQVVDRGGDVGEDVIQFHQGLLDRDANATVLQRMVATLEIRLATDTVGDAVALVLFLIGYLMNAKVHMERTGEEVDPSFALEEAPIDFGFDTPAFTEKLLHLLEQTFEDEEVYEMSVMCLNILVLKGGMHEHFMAKGGVAVVTRTFLVAAPGTDLQLFSLKLIARILCNSPENGATVVAEFLAVASIGGLVAVFDADPGENYGPISSACMYILYRILEEHDDLQQTVKEAGFYELAIKALKAGVDCWPFVVQPFCMFFSPVLKHSPDAGSLLISENVVSDVLACLSQTIEHASNFIVAASLLDDLFALEQTSVEHSFHAAGGFGILLEARKSHPQAFPAQLATGDLLLTLSQSHQNAMSKVEVVESFVSAWKQFPDEESLFHQALVGMRMFLNGTNKDTVEVWLLSTDIVSPVIDYLKRHKDVNGTPAATSNFLRNLMEVAKQSGIPEETGIPKEIEAAGGVAVFTNIQNDPTVVEADRTAAHALLQALANSDDPAASTAAKEALQDP